MKQISMSQNFIFLFQKVSKAHIYRLHLLQKYIFLLKKMHILFKKYFWNKSVVVFFENIRLSVINISHGVDQMKLLE